MSQPVPCILEHKRRKEKGKKIMFFCSEPVATPNFTRNKNTKFLLTYSRTQQNVPKRNRRIYESSKPPSVAEPCPLTRPHGKSETFFYRKHKIIQEKFGHAYSKPELEAVVIATQARKENQLRLIDLQIVPKRSSVAF